MRWLVVAFLCVAAGCTPRPRAAGPAREFRWAISTDVLTLDPARVTEDITGDVLRQVYQTLVTIDGDGRAAPGVAKAWELSPDGRTMTFHLDRASFSDGTAVTSHDVKVSLERLLAPEIASSYGSTYRSGIAPDGILTPDPSTVVLRLTRPDSTLLGRLTYPVCSIVPARFAHRGISTVDDAVGSGPFRLAEHTPGQRIVLVPNPHAWAAKPQIDRILILPITDSATAIAKFEAGELDFMPVKGQDAPAVQENRSLAPFVRPLPRASVSYLQFQSGACPPLRDVRVRRAIAMAIDRDRLVGEILHGQPLIATRAIPAGTAGATDQILPAFDVPAARKLLAAAGYPDGRGFPRVEMACNEANKKSPAVEAVASDLRTNLGLDVVVRGYASAALLEANQKHRLPLFLTGWVADYNDADNTLRGLFASDSGTNHCDLRDPEVDQLLDLGLAERDPIRRSKIYHQAEARALESVPIVPLIFPRSLALVAKRVDGLRPTAYGLPELTALRLNP